MYSDPFKGYRLMMANREKRGAQGKKTLTCSAGRDYIAILISARRGGVDAAPFRTADIKGG